jgi:hypothetical protein
MGSVTIPYTIKMHNNTSYARSSADGEITVCPDNVGDH